MATPDVGDIWAEEYQFNDFTIFHKDIKSTPLFGVGIGYDTGHYFRFDITGEYRGKSLFVAQASTSWTQPSPAISIPAPTNGRRTSISVLGLKDVNVPNNGVAFGKDNTETTSPGRFMAVFPMT